MSRDFTSNDPRTAMNRRNLLITLAASVSLGSPVHAETRALRYNLSSVLAKRTYYGRYGGKRIIDYRTNEPPGTIIVDTPSRRLFFVLNATRVIEYGIGVGRQGFAWSGTAHVGNKREWPEWHPPEEMIQRELREYGRRLPDVMPGGPDNPLGARALYLYEGNRDTLYRIHGTNAPETIGQAVSSGCIRLINPEVIDLYNRAKIGAKVFVL